MRGHLRQCVERLAVVSIFNQQTHDLHVGSSVSCAACRIAPHRKKPTVQDKVIAVGGIRLHFEDDKECESVVFSKLVLLLEALIWTST